MFELFEVDEEFVVVDGGELENFEAKVGVDGMTELLLVVRGGRELKLVAGVMAMNDGEASGLLEPGENVEDVDNEGDELSEDEFVFVDDKVAGLIISVLAIEGESLEGDIVEAIDLAAKGSEVLEAAFSLDVLAGSCLDCEPDVRCLDSTSLSYFLFLSLFSEIFSIGEESRFLVNNLSESLFRVLESLSSFFTF